MMCVQYIGDKKVMLGDKWAIHKGYMYMERIYKYWIDAANKSGNIGHLDICIGIDYVMQTQGGGM